MNPLQRILNLCGSTTTSSIDEDMQPYIYICQVVIYDGATLPRNETQNTERKKIGNVKCCHYDIEGGGSFLTFRTPRLYLFDAANSRSLPSLTTPAKLQ